MVTKYHRREKKKSIWLATNGREGKEKRRRRRRKRRRRVVSHAS
jgi:hypothetical protein